MFTHNETNRFFGRVLTGLVITATMVVGALTHAISNSQAFL